MEELLKTHRQEQKDLQARITQKKKSTTKKTRKGVNDECSELERQLKEKQDLEISSLTQNLELNESAGQALATNGQGELTGQRPITGLEEPLQNPATSKIVAKPADGPAKRPNRQKARIARRAAEQEAAANQAAKEAENVPNLREKEIVAMQQEYSKRGLKEQPIRSDGHCLYAAVADQLTDSNLGLKPKVSLGTLDLDTVDPRMGYKATRQVAAAYIAAHSDDFVSFLEEPLDTYVRTIRETGEWGGHLELSALARAYAVNINVLQGDGKVEVIQCGSDDSESLWLAYYRHHFGLGEHYNSLRRKEQ